MNASFLTSGSSRKLKLGNRTVTLTHGSPKKFAYKGKLMPELVQALRSIGEDNITESVEKELLNYYLQHLKQKQLNTICYWHRCG